MTTVDNRRVDRTKVSPFLIRVFVKQYPGHRTSQFDGPDFPAQDEFQVYTWMDSTLQELLLTLRAIASPLPSSTGASGNITNTASAELHHPLAKYSFRSVYPDPATGGRFQSKDLGDVYARDLSDASIFEKPFPPPAASTEPVEVSMDQEESIAKDGVDGKPADAKADDGAEPMDTTDNAAAPPIDDGRPENGRESRRHTTGREARTLQDLRFRKGDYLAISVRFPKTVAAPGLPPVSTNFGPGGFAGPGGLSIRGTAGGPGAPGRGGFGGRDIGPARQIPWVTSPVTPTANAILRGDGRRGAAWRGGPPTGPARGGFGGRGDGPGDRRGMPPPRDDRDGDRRGGSRGGRRGGPSRGGRRSRSGSRSPRRRSRSRDLSMVSSRSRRSKSLSKSRSRSPLRRDNK